MNTVRTRFGSFWYWFVFLLLLIGGVTCTKKEGPIEPNPGPKVEALTVSPDTGPPGSIVQISGYRISSSDSGITELYVAGEFIPFSLDSDSTIIAVLPLFLDSSGWSSPPAGAQDIEIRRFGEVVGTAPKAITITPLLPAPGTTEKVHQSLTSIVTSLENIFILVPVDDSMETPVREGLVAGLKAIVTDGDSSLAAILDGTSSVWGSEQPNVELMDALLSSTGMAKYFETFASGLRSANDSVGQLIETRRASGLFCEGGGPDMDLACKMQIYVVLNYYSEQFVHPTAQTWANTVGLGAGVIALIGRNVPAVAIISAILTVMDFVMQDVVPAMFPSQITEFQLNLENDTIAIDEYTRSSLTISAVNTPTPMTLNDMINVALSLLPLIPNEAAQGFKAVLMRTYAFVLDQYRGKLLAYEQQHPGTYTDPALTSIPMMTWGPVEVTNPDLVELYSFDQSIIDGDEATFEWQGMNNGEGRIQARTRGAGDRAKVLIDNALCWGCVYSGGAFGENIEHTETKSVWVGDKGKLLVKVLGLPLGVFGDVLLTGPGGTSPVTETKQFNDLDIGDYILTAIDVVGFDSTVYKPDTNQQSFVLRPGDSVSVTVQYGEKHGKLNLVVTGLPSGVQGDIVLLHPDGTVTNYGSSTVVKKLLPGKYIVLAKTVLDNGTRYNPSPDSAQTRIVAGKSNVIVIDYAQIRKSLDMRIRAGSQMAYSKIGMGWVGLANDKLFVNERPIVSDQCNDGVDYVSLIPFRGNAMVSTSGQQGGMIASVLTSSSDSTYVKISLSGNASATPSSYGSGGGASFRVNAGSNPASFVDIFNSELDTLNVEIKWSFLGTGMDAMIPSGSLVKARSYAWFQIRGYNETDPCLSQSFRISRSSSGLDLNWNITGDTTVLFTKAYGRMQLSINANCLANSSYCPADTASPPNPEVCDGGYGVGTFSTVSGYVRIRIVK